MTPGWGWLHRLAAPPSMDPPPSTNPPTDYGLAAQRAAEERLEAAWAALDDEEGECEDPELAGPFCGCTTCLVREVLDAAYPHLREAWKADL